VSYTLIENGSQLQISIQLRTIVNSDISISSLSIEPSTISARSESDLPHAFVRRGYAGGISMAGDRVRRNTANSVNLAIDEKIEANVKFYSTQTRDCITRRINQLDSEWDIERWLQMNASTIAFSGVVLSQLHSRKWLMLTATVLPFLFLHAVQGWCPPVPVMRRLGVRTREEIDREKYALKALRGDFDTLPVPGVSEAEKMPRATEALEAVQA
jgi:hypothetical protein